MDNTEMRHFEARTQDQLALIEYQIQERKYFLTRVDFPEGFEEKGFADEMMQSVLKIIEETGLKVVPMNRYVKAYFKRHRELKKLLPVGLHF